MRERPNVRFAVVAPDLSQYTDHYRTSGEAMDAAVRKAFPSLLRKRDCRKAWLEMKEDGYRLQESHP